MEVLSASSADACSGSEDDAGSEHDCRPPRKRNKTSRELPAEAIALFKNWMLSEKNFSHPVRIFVSTLNCLFSSVWFLCFIIVPKRSGMVIMHRVVLTF